MKTRIFVDFWNFQLSFNEQFPGFQLDWAKLSPWLVQAASELVGQPLDFEGTTVYVSYDPHSDKERSLHRWAHNVLDLFTGVHVAVLERKPKRSPVCQQCHGAISVCPTCGARIAATVEKGVDTSIVTDLLSLAWENAWDVAVLVSSDRDFIPAVKLLHTKGFKVINASFAPKGMELSGSCWACIDMRTALPHLLRS